MSLDFPSASSTPPDSGSKEDAVRGCLIVDIQAHQEQNVLKRIFIETLFVGRKEVRVYTTSSNESHGHSHCVYTYNDDEGQEHVVYDLREIPDTNSPAVLVDTPSSDRSIFKRPSETDNSILSYPSCDDTEKLRNLIVKKEFIMKRSSDTSIQRRGSTKYPRYVLINPVLVQTHSDPLLDNEGKCCSCQSSPTEYHHLCNENLRHRSRQLTPEHYTHSPELASLWSHYKRPPKTCNHSGSLDEVDSNAVWNNQPVLTPNNSLNLDYFQRPSRTGVIHLTPRPPREGNMLNVRPPLPKPSEEDASFSLFPCIFM